MQILTYLIIEHTRGIVSIEVFLLVEMQREYLPRCRQVPAARHLFVRSARGTFYARQSLQSHVEVLISGNSSGPQHHSHGDVAWLFGVDDVSDCGSFYLGSFT